MTNTDKIVDNIRKNRIDLGKKRIKYDSSLPKKYKSYLARCNRKGIELNLTVDEFNFILSKECVYCGSSAQTIDRIDSSGNYDLENSQPCCNKCNLMKYTYSEQEFINHIKKIYKYIQEYIN